VLDIISSNCNEKNKKYELNIMTRGGEYNSKCKPLEI